MDQQNVAPATFVLYYRVRLPSGTVGWLRGGNYKTAKEANELGAAWKVATLLRGGQDQMPAYKVVRRLEKSTPCPRFSIASEPNANT